ncbi:MAG: serine/threonine protein kinase, partial [Gemmatimonadaceae bacterium]|nr:serine/threonine protein kinase [Gemmatimonadaceae bacterium]
MARHGTSGWWPVCARARDRARWHGGVYLARDASAARDVALKMLRDDVASAVNTERFLREISLAKSLSHPNVLPLLDSGSTEEGLPYYVMPVVNGESLRDRLLCERRLPVDMALAIVVQAADALSAAHELGILHRDVTPGNILLNGEHAYLSDFGIPRALLYTGGERLTGTGIVIGTPEYMSPEQGAGDSDIDARADLYSLASVLYTALAGEPPFTGPTGQAVLARKAVARAPSVHELRPTVPIGIARAIAQALEPVPADRQRSVKEFAAQLIAGEEMRPVARRRRGRWLVAGVGAVVVVAGIVGFATRSPVRRAERDLADGQLGAAVRRLRPLVARDPRDGRAALALAQALLLTGGDTTREARDAARLAAAAPR